MNIKRYIPFLMIIVAETAVAQDDTTHVDDLEGVVVKESKYVFRTKLAVENRETIGSSDLLRAACCSLGESFTNNPSVDVNYSDATTGARQIKLLGLSGTYVQMLTENVPNLRGAAIPYSLSYIPGTWMQSIQVSKGASSVKNGPESITGQINVELIKPHLQDGVWGNVYADSKLKTEANATGAIHLNNRLSTALLLHAENASRAHDANDDSFMDMPKVQQLSFANRWAYQYKHIFSQLMVKMLHEERIGGQTNHNPLPGVDCYHISLNTDRYEGQWKNAYMFHDDHNTSIALILAGQLHRGDNVIGKSVYDVNNNTGYAQLLFETDLSEKHNLAAGASYNFDYFKEDIGLSNPSADNINGLHHLNEATVGAYAQYTLKLGDKFTAMAGVREDYNEAYGSFFTPRVHLKYSPCKLFSIRASSGKGYRTPHALAENTPLLAMGRTIHIDQDIEQEEAWNHGLSTSFNIPVAEKDLLLNAEYYYTDFKHQLIVNREEPGVLAFQNLDGSSYSHTLQFDATYPVTNSFEVTAAYRWQSAKSTYYGQLKDRPLTSRYKGLLTLSYKTPLEKWQFDVTGQLIGPSRLYTPVNNSDETSPYGLLNMQVTREFRLFSIYVGGENMTNYKQKNPILGAENPWGTVFDATQIWAPTDGIMGYVGVRFKFNKYR